MSLRGLGSGLWADEAELPHEDAILDIEREIVLRMQPRSRRSVTVQVTYAGRAKPHVVAEAE